MSSHGTNRVPGIPEESEQAHLPSSQTPARLRSRLSTRLSLRRPTPAPTPAPSHYPSPQRTRPPAPPPYFYPRPITTDYWEEFSDESSGLNDRLYAQLHRVLAEQRYKEQRRTDRRRLHDLKAAAGLGECGSAKAAKVSGLKADLPQRASLPHPPRYLQKTSLSLHSRFASGFCLLSQLPLWTRSPTLLMPRSTAPKSHQPIGVLPVVQVVRPLHFSLLRHIKPPLSRSDGRSTSQLGLGTSRI